MRARLLLATLAKVVQPQVHHDRDFHFGVRLLREIQNACVQPRLTCIHEYRSWAFI